MKPFKLYLSETLGRSCDISEKYKNLLTEEPCFYANCVSERQLLRADPDIPESYFDSFENGTDKRIEEVNTVDGPDKFYIWDSPGSRFFVELDSLEDLDAFTLCLDVPLTLVRRDLDNEFSVEFTECIFGTPLISDAMVGELETVEVPKMSSFEEDEDSGDWWKQMD